MVQLTHGCVNNWKSCLALGPFLKLFVVVLPFDVRILRLERLVHTYEWPVNQDMLVEVSPSDFANPSLHSLEATVQLLRRVRGLCSSDASTRRECAGC